MPELTQQEFIEGARNLIALSAEQRGLSGEPLDSLNLQFEQMINEGTLNPQSFALLLSQPRTFEEVQQGVPESPYISNLRETVIAENTAAQQPPPIVTGKQQCE